MLYFVITCRRRFCMNMMDAFELCWDIHKLILSFRCEFWAENRLVLPSSYLGLTNSFLLNTRMPSHFLSLFKPRSRSRSQASQSESSIQNSSSSAALNASSTIDRATVAVVSQSERSIFTPRVSASPARSVAVNGLKFALRQLGKAPVPGIDLATSSLLDVINRIEVNQEALLEKNTDLVQEHGRRRQRV